MFPFLVFYSTADQNIKLETLTEFQDHWSETQCPASQTEDSAWMTAVAAREGRLGGEKSRQTTLKQRMLTRSRGEVYLGLSDLDLALIVTFVCHPHIFISVISPLPSPMRGLDGFVFSLGWMLFQNKPFMVLGCC